MRKAPRKVTVRFEARVYAEPIVGCASLHPEHGLVFVTAGQMWADGRLSNFWRFRPIRPDGTLGDELAGYGWRDRSGQVSSALEDAG